MKIFASIVLLFFVFFLAAPTIVVWLENDKENSSLCRNSNDPSSSSCEEIKNDIKYYTMNFFSDILFFDFKERSGLIVFENLSKHDLNYASIFLPPPNYHC
jgi:hypothetical protein